MNKLALVVAAALTAASFGGVALAQDNRTDFYHADTNHDNYVTFAEAQALFPTLTQEMFDKADENHDGKLTDSEYAVLLGLTAGLPGAGGGGNDKEHHEEHHDEHHDDKSHEPT